MFKNVKNLKDEMIKFSFFIIRDYNFSSEKRSKKNNDKSGLLEN